MEGYNVTIKESSRKFTAREAIAIKDLSNAIQIDGSIQGMEDSLIITPADYAVLAVHNERSKNDKDYTKYVVLDSAGNKFVTGSVSFFTSFMEIYSTMKEEAPGEEYSITAYRRPSKNYAGGFITCSID